jgi:hypothetical protein
MSFFAELGLSTTFTMISLVPMVPEWLRGNPQPQTKINVMVGLPPLSPEQQAEKDHIYKQLSYGGSAPEISLFNANGDRVGHYRNWNCDKVIDQNSPTDLWADYRKEGNTEKAEYITVAATGTDAICISAVAVTYPTSSDTYAFLSGEVAAVCNNYKSEFDYYWSESETTVQFRSESGKTHDGRPKCMWIDQADSDGNKVTHYEGFQVNLPDFKLDNSTFKTWQDDPSNMCDSLARFGSYDRLNAIICPEIFSLHHLTARISHWTRSLRVFRPRRMALPILMSATMIVSVTRIGATWSICMIIRAQPTTRGMTDVSLMVSVTQSGVQSLEPGLHHHALLISHPHLPPPGSSDAHRPLLRTDSLLQIIRSRRDLRECWPRAETLRKARSVCARAKAALGLTFSPNMNRCSAI